MDSLSSSPLAPRPSETEKSSAPATPKSPLGSPIQKTTSDLGQSSLSSRREDQYHTPHIPEGEILQSSSPDIAQEASHVSEGISHVLPMPSKTMIQEEREAQISALEQQYNAEQANYDQIKEKIANLDAQYKTESDPIKRNNILNEMGNLSTQVDQIIDHLSDISEERLRLLISSKTSPPMTSARSSQEGVTVASEQNISSSSSPQTAASSLVSPGSPTSETTEIERLEAKYKEVKAQVEDALKECNEIAVMYEEAQKLPPGPNKMAKLTELSNQHASASLKHLDLNEESASIKRQITNLQKQQQAQNPVQQGSPEYVPLPVDQPMAKVVQTEIKDTDFYDKPFKADKAIFTFSKPGYPPLEFSLADAAVKHEQKLEDLNKEVIHAANALGGAPPEDKAYWQAVLDRHHQNLERAMGTYENEMQHFENAHKLIEKFYENAPEERNNPHSKAAIELTALLIASKMGEEASVWSADMFEDHPELDDAGLTKADLNRMEKTFLIVIKHEVMLDTSPIRAWTELVQSGQLDSTVSYEQYLIDQAQEKLESAKTSYSRSRTMPAMIKLEKALKEYNEARQKMDGAKIIGEQFVEKQTYDFGGKPVERYQVVNRSSTPPIPENLRYQTALENLERLNQELSKVQNELNAIPDRIPPMLRRIELKAEADYLTAKVADAQSRVDLLKPSTQLPPPPRRFPPKRK